MDMCCPHMLGDFLDLWPFVYCKLNLLARYSQYRQHAANIKLFRERSSYLELSSDRYLRMVKTWNRIWEIYFSGQTYNEWYTWAAFSKAKSFAGIRVRECLQTFRSVVTVSDGRYGVSANYTLSCLLSQPKWQPIWIQTILFIPILDTTTKFVIMTVWLSWTFA